MRSSQPTTVRGRRGAQYPPGAERVRAIGPSRAGWITHAAQPRVDLPQLIVAL
ncbi:MAG: hypothetical protein ABSH35_09140 [Isosphaeraceae bacterium]